LIANKVKSRSTFGNATTECALKFAKGERENKFRRVLEFRNIGEGGCIERKVFGKCGTQKVEAGCQSDGGLI